MDVVGEIEIASLEPLEKMMSAPPTSKTDQKEIEKIMAGYHDLVGLASAQIYKLKG